MEENKWARLEIALSLVDPTDPTKFKDMRDSMHIDEKWFFLTREKEVYHLLPVIEIWAFMPLFHIFNTFNQCFQDASAQVTEALALMV